MIMYISIYKAKYILHMIESLNIKKISYYL